MNDINIKILERAGLNNKESQIYLSLLELGPSSISEIARHSGLHRADIYKNINNLHSQGLISISLKGKNKRYLAEPPVKLKKLADDLKEDFKRIIPNLQNLYDAQSEMPIVKFLEGKDGIKSVFLDVVQTLNNGEAYYTYSSRKTATQGYLPPDYGQIRDQKNLRRFGITSEALIKTKKPPKHEPDKIIPEKYGLFNYNVKQIIYGNKIAFIDFNSETAVIIENPIIAEFQRKIFKILYDLL